MRGRERDDYGCQDGHAGRQAGRQLNLAQRSTKRDRMDGMARSRGRWWLTHPYKSIIPGRLESRSHGMAWDGPHLKAWPLLCPLPSPPPTSGDHSQCRGRAGRVVALRGAGAGAGTWDGMAWEHRLPTAQPSGLPCPFLLWPERHRRGIDRDTRPGVSAPEKANGRPRRQAFFVHPYLLRGRRDGGGACPANAGHGIHDMAWNCP